MKPGDEVEFNNSAPKYLVKRFGNRPNTIEGIKDNVWVSLEEDQKRDKTAIHLIWLRIVKEA